MSSGADDMRSRARDHHDNGSLRTRDKWIVILVGATSWLTGAVATFVAADGAAAAALIIVGVVCVLVGMIGRWPQRLVVGSHEVDFRTVRDVVAEGFQHSGSSSPEEEARIAEDRLRTYERTGRLPEHPAAAYDREVVAALKALFPDASLLTQTTRTRKFADFELREANKRLYIETKWKNNETGAWHGSTISQLAGQVPEDASLLVITNASDVTVGSQELARHLGARGEAVSWRPGQDRTRLREAALRAISGH